MDMKLINEVLSSFAVFLVQAHLPVDVLQIVFCEFVVDKYTCSEIIFSKISRRFVHYKLRNGDYMPDKQITDLLSTAIDVNDVSILRRLAVYATRHEFYDYNLLQKFYVTMFLHAAEKGYLDILKLLWRNRTNYIYFSAKRIWEVKAYDTGDDTFLQTAMAKAVLHGHLETVIWLQKTGNLSCPPTVMDLAAGGGHLDILEFLHSVPTTNVCTFKAMDNAAANGHLETVKWLHAHRSEGCTTEAMDGAALNGHLETVKWLHQNRTEGCTTLAMDLAAEGGHLEIVKFLHKNRTEGCTTEAMNQAASYGHFEVVKFLHENRTEGCTIQAMDRAAASGNLNLVKWLHENRTEGCTTDAMDYAAKYGHLDVLKFLHAFRKEGCTNLALREATRERHMHVVEWLRVTVYKK